MNTTKLKVTLLVVSFFLNPTYAQITIDGTISDSDNYLLPNVIVELFDSDYTSIQLSSTNESGYFIFTNITDINYSESQIPGEHIDIRNYPNPFNPSTIVYFKLPKSDNIEIKIFDILGRKVRSLYSGFRNAGVEQMVWDGRNDFNQPVASGIYLCQLKTKNHSKVHKMVILDGGSSVSVKSNYNLEKHDPAYISRIAPVFNFTIKVSGDSIHETYFSNLTCSNDTTLSLIVSRSSKETTIGIDGGILETEEFKLTVPKGAFSSSYSLKLSEESDNTALGENAISSLYRIDGFPLDFNDSIEVKIKYSGSLEGTSFMMFGSQSELNLIDTSFIDLVYTPFEVREESGFLAAKIPPRKRDENKNLSKKSVDEGGAFFLGLLTKGEKWEPLQSHFKFLYKADNINLEIKNKINDLLELSYDKYLTLFGSDMDSLELPITVSIEREEFKNIIVYSKFNDIQNYKDGIICVVNPSSDDENMFYSLNFSLGEYIIKKIYSDAYEEFLLSIPLWYTFTIYFWEEYTVSKLISLYFYSVLDGLNLSKNSNYFHCSIFLEYLTNRYGISVIKDIIYGVGSLKESGIDPNLWPFVLDDPNNWLADFYINILTDDDIISRFTRFNLYPNYWLDKVEQEITVSNNDDTVVVLKKYNNLSAKLFRVKLGNDFNTEDSLSFSIAGGISELSLFKLENSRIVFIDKSNAGITIENIKNLAESGTDLLVLVTNNAELPGSSEISLSIKKGKRIPKIVGCSVTLLSIRGNLLKDGAVYINDRLFSVFIEKDIAEATVTFKNDTLIQEYDNYVNSFGETFTEYIEIIFDKTMTSVLSFSAHRVAKLRATVGYYTVTNELSAANIPLNNNYNNEPYLNFRSQGLGVCSQLTSLSIVHVDNDGTVLAMQEGSQYCSDGTTLNVYVHRE